MSALQPTHTTHNHTPHPHFASQVWSHLTCQPHPPHPTQALVNLATTHNTSHVQSHTLSRSPIHPLHPHHPMLTQTMHVPCNPNCFNCDKCGKDSPSALPHFGPSSQSVECIDCSISHPQTCPSLQHNLTLTHNHITTIPNTYWNALTPAPIPHTAHTNMHSCATKVNSNPINTCQHKVCIPSTPRGVTPRIHVGATQPLTVHIMVILATQTVAVMHDCIARARVCVLDD